jgi:hypothetical protein
MYSTSIHIRDRLCNSALPAKGKKRIKKRAAGPLSSRRLFSGSVSDARRVHGVLFYYGP